MSSFLTHGRAIVPSRRRVSRPRRLRFGCSCSRPLSLARTDGQALSTEPKKRRGKKEGKERCSSTELSSLANFTDARLGGPYGLISPRHAASFFLVPFPLLVQTSSGPAQDRYHLVDVPTSMTIAARALERREIASHGRVMLDDTGILRCTADRPDRLRTIRSYTPDFVALARG